MPKTTGLCSSYSRIYGTHGVLTGRGLSVVRATAVKASPSSNKVGNHYSSQYKILRHILEQLQPASLSPFTARFSGSDSKQTGYSYYILGAQLLTAVIAPTG